MHALLRLRLNRSLRERIEWRHGFLAAVDRRTFSSLPPAMTDAEVTGSSKESKSFAEGFRHGMTCPLAVSVPDHATEVAENDDSFSLAAWVSAAAVLIVTVTLYFQNH